MQDLRKPLVIKTILSALMLLFGCQNSLADSGQDKYTPTKLDWLAVELNAMYRQDYAPPLITYTVSYVPFVPNTVLILIQHNPNETKAVLDMAEGAAKKLIQTEQKMHGWNWVKTKVEYRILKKSSE